MRDLDHYIKLFSTDHTIGRTLVAQAIYAGRYGDADDPDTDKLREITRELPDRVLESSEATQIVRDAIDWRAHLERDPIPDWAIRAAIYDRGFTQPAFAEQVGVSLSAVEAWLSGRRNCSGPTAKIVRIIFKNSAK